MNRDVFSPVAATAHKTVGAHPAHPEFHQLAVFLRVVESGTFTGAARRLGCSQPAISQTIRRLEDIYGGDLFTRRPGAPLRLTPIARAILPSVRRVIDTVDRQMVDAMSAARSRSGTLSVGFCPGFFDGRFLIGLAAFAAEAPAVQLRLAEASPQALPTALDRCRIDILVAPLSGTLDDTRHENAFLWNERLVAAIPEKSPLAGPIEIHGSALRPLRLFWPWYIGEALRDSVLGAQINESRSPPLHEVTPTTILDLVARDRGAGIIPASAATPRPGVCFRPLSGEHARIAIHACWLRDDANPLRHRLLRHLRATSHDA
ncbi:LysR family transcriptional regulator [Sphingomonas sp. CL5.1]|uniref:LysR family transcriptional regulator n=1 Tax=Sphingomonas sp. CL5.1 TaxID=2653203 RepID=UPI001582A62A|nr:LysR family transcriptional regulator [Sphingomonas sp. CL5.1]QKR98307.1 LysR family transcriptional regulator [Sphingomonas sp. CL5.1]